MREQAVVFGESNSLIGIVTDPSESSRTLNTGVILLNPGVVHRVAPGRVYVKIARALAGAGFVVLRFDFSGIGDSAVRRDNLPFEKSAVAETQDAIEFLKGTREIERFILLGGCSGARVSFRTACSDRRVVCAIPINFPVSDDEDSNPDLINQRVAQYYWKFAFFNLKSWIKLFTGKADYSKIFKALRSQARRRLSSERTISSESPQLAEDLNLLGSRGVRLVFLYSENDPRLGELREAGGKGLKRLCELEKIQLEVIRRADHTFSSLDDQERLVEAILAHVETITPARANCASTIRDGNRAAHQVLGLTCTEAQPG